MNKLQSLVAASALAIAITFTGIAANAAEEKQLALVVDVQKIFEKSTAALKMKEQIDKKAEEFKKDSAAKEDAFKKKFEDLEKQKSVLAKDAYEKKSNDLNKEFADAQQKVQDNRAAIDKGYVDAMQQFEAALTEIVKQEADKAGSKIVLPKMQVIYNDASIEITDKVLEALNKKLPDLKMKF
jgi:outer membrane protein